MGRFERDIRKKFKSEAHSAGKRCVKFDDWQKSNSADLVAFSVRTESESGGAKVRTRRAGWLTAALLAIFIVVVAALAVVFLLPDGGMQDITDNTGGGVPSDSVTVVRALTEEEMASIAAEYPFIAGISADMGGTMACGEGGVPLLASIAVSTEYGGCTDIIFRIEYNGGCDFAYKKLYFSLPESSAAGDYSVTWGEAEETVAAGGDNTTLYKVSGGGGELYIEVECAEDCTAYILDLIAGGG